MFEKLKKQLFDKKKYVSFEVKGGKDYGPAVLVDDARKIIDKNDAEYQKILRSILKEARSVIADCKKDWGKDFRDQELEKMSCESEVYDAGHVDGIDYVLSMVENRLIVKK